MAALADAGARALLIGTGRHAEGSGLESLPAVERSIRDVGEVLVERCGLAWDRVRVVLDAISPTETGTALAEEAEQATSALLVYYVGHGLVGLGGELYLATQATDRRPGWLAHTALAYNAVRNSLLETAAKSLIVVLDCCYSGRALGVLGSAQDEAADLTRVQGGFVLTSAAANELALAPEGEPYTTFTGEFLNLLRNGDPDGPSQLTLQSIYGYLARMIPARGGPRPRRVVTGLVDDLVLAANPAYRPTARPRQSTVSVPRASADVCPYPGLVPFEAAQADWFFGRERLTTELAARLAGRLGEGDPLVVVAPSGTGKSSLLRAGLIPALGRGALAAPGSRRWPRLVMTPGASPLTALAAQVAPFVRADQAALASTFAQEPGQGAQVFRDVLCSVADGDPTGARVVLVVDQFEEVFTLCADEVERRAFIELLGILASGTPEAGPTGLIVLGLRADFYGQCAAFPQLRDAVQRDQVLVGPMSAAELRAAIERPAQAVGLELEPGLTELLLRDIGASDLARPAPEAYEAGRLPLIAYALRETWEQRDGAVLTVAGYQCTGGIHHAIASTADSTFLALPEDSQEEARLLFLRLVKIGDGTQDARRRVSAAELLGRSRSGAAAEQALTAFVQARLLTSSQDSVEISHDALLEAWPRLQQWVNSDRAGNLLGQELEDATTAWEHSGQDSSALLRGSRLDAALGWARERADTGTVSPITRAFLQESRHQQDRARRLRRSAVVVLAVVALVAAGTAWLAVQQRTAAQASSRKAILNQVTAEAEQVGSTDQSLAAELNLLAYRMNPTMATYTKLVSAEDTPLSTVVPVPSGTVDSVAFSPGGHVLAGASTAGVLLWDLTGPSHARLLGTPLAARDGPVSSVAFSPGGHILAGGGAAGVRLWDVSSPSRPRLLGSPLAAPDGSVSSVAFSPDGHVLADATGSSVQLWDITDPALPRLLGTPLAAPDGTVSSVAFSPDGRTLADATGSSVQLWDITDPAHPRLLGTPLGPLPNADGHPSLILSLAFSPDGGTLAAGAADHHVHLWQVANPADPVSLGYLFHDFDSITSVCFSPDGNLLATGSADDMASVWDVTDPGAGTLVYPSLTGHTAGILAVAMSPDGHTLATASADHTVRLWALPRSVAPGHASYVDSLAISRTRGIAASGSPDDTVRLWDVANPARVTPLSAAIKGTAQYNGLSFSPDGRILAASTSDNDVQLWRVADPTHPTPLGQPLGGFSAYVATVAISPDGRILAAGSFDHTIRLWNIANPAQPALLGAPLHGPAGGVTSVAFSPDGRTLAAGSLDGTVRLWNVTIPADPRPLGAPLAGHGGGIYTVAFSPDGRTLASGDARGTLRLWNVSDPARASALGGPLTGHTDTVASVAFSPDGRTLASGSWDYTVRLWNVADPARAQAIGGPITSSPDYVNAIAFGPGGHTLMGADGDNTVLSWNLSAPAVVQHICASTADVLTPAKWHRYVSELPFNPPCGAGR